MDEQLPFTLLEQMNFQSGDAALYRHPSGAQLLTLKGSGRENCLSITFRTPTPDDSGFPHVLEHMVLRGSRRYPDDQLYTSLLQGSLASHLNASTRAEHTSFQAASPSVVDILRLQEVLLDALFHPLLSRHAFAQEGPSGVVFNEMCGHFARIEARLEQGLARLMFGEHPLGRAYGGLPEAMGTLSLEALRAFHAHHYRAGNCLLILTGEGLPKRIEALAAQLPSDPLVPPQPKPAPASRPKLEGPLGHHALGFKMPMAEALHQALIARHLLRQAGADALNGSAYVSDCSSPYVEIFSQNRVLDAIRPPTLPQLQADLAQLAAEATDEARDFRLPPDLQSRPDILQAWLRGDSPLSALQLCERIKVAEADPMACLARITDLMQGLVPFRLQTTGTEARPPKPPAPTNATTPVGGYKLPPLPVKDWPRQLPPHPFARQGKLLTLGSQGPSQTLLAFDANGIAPELLAQMPHLLGSLCDEQTKAFLSQDGSLTAFVAWQGRSTSPLQAKTSAILPKPAQHLQLEHYLRAGFSQGEAQVEPIFGLRSQTALPDPALIAQLATALFTRSRIWAATTDQRQSQAIEALCQGLPQGQTPQPAPVPLTDSCHLHQEGPLFHLGLAMDLSHLPRAHAMAALKAIEYGHLWPQLREIGGAYGVKLALSPKGIATIMSLRDPNGAESLSTIRASGAWLATHASAQILPRAQLAAIATILKPRTTREELRLLLEAQIQGEYILWSQADLDQCHSLTLPQLRALGDAIDHALTQAKTVIIGP